MDTELESLHQCAGELRTGRIAGQKKVFGSREELDKYLNGRIKAHQHLFTEISPAIPKEYADYFKVNGLLLPGYASRGKNPSRPPSCPSRPPGPGKNSRSRPPLSNRLKGGNP